MAQGASPVVQKTLDEALQHHQAGRLNEAERLYRQNLAVNPRHADSLHLLGMIAYQVGRHDVAVELISKAISINAKLAFYHSNLGLALTGQGKLGAAISCFRQALALEPNFVEAHTNLGNALKDQGKLDEAIACYRRALAIKPDLAEGHNNLGNALSSQGKLDEAAASYRQALIIRPNYAEAHSNLGNVLRDEGKLDEAVGCYRQAIVLSPNIAEVHNNLGNALRDLEKLDEAIACYRKALKLNPAYSSCLNNLALLRIAQGDAVAALSTIRQSLEIEETADAKRIFTDCMKNYNGRDSDREIHPILTRAMTEPWCRPSKLVRAAVGLIKRSPDVGECISRAASAWPRRLSAQEFYGSNGRAALANDNLLRALLCTVPIADVAMERFLTAARRLILDAAIDKQAPDSESIDLNFYSALVRQCFVNEYVFCHANDEIQKANDLREALIAALKTGTRVPALWLLAVAAYFPLLSIPSAERLLDMSWPEPVATIPVQQIEEPKEEQQLRVTIPRLTDVANAVSQLVQTQYEENPYPRWVKMEPAGTPRTIVEYLSQQISPTSFHHPDDRGRTDILIAGCGTGQHSIGMAQILKDAHVLAVDLSLSSLGYAKRKTKELELTSIEYAQADLLELGSLDRQFDMIGSAGVLHHLADPFAGWQVLLSLLRPGGFMNLGFYSAVARQNIVRAQNFIAERGYKTTADDIRRCRQDLMSPEQCANFPTVLNSPDFYSMSNCRDLLFHVQEHLMTLTGIESFLRDNNLAFLGFEIDREIRDAYKRRFPDDPAATNLGCWRTFENENPLVFAAMYQFWIQKPFLKQA